MKILFFLTLLFQVGCATKYLVPGNRFLTPETQGGAFRGQFEFQQTSANQLTIDTSNNSVEEGVLYDDLSRAGFLLSNSLFDQFDIYWSHIGGANSMLGAKFQFLGSSRVAKGVGHKMSLAAAVGGNEHETEDDSVEFELSGKEFMVLYGYRLTPNIFPYSSFSYATYNFSGEIRSSNPALNGAEPELETEIRSFSLGVEFSFEAFFTKLETTYQQLQTTDTKDKSRFLFGYSLGLSW